MRVDGENFAAAPIERILTRLPEVSRVAVYPVPDESVGDQVMAAIVLRDGATLTPESVRGVPRRPARPVAEGVAAVRLDRRRPAVTATNKILKRELVSSARRRRAAAVEA